jgi:hypothetical protein
MFAAQLPGDAAMAAVEAFSSACDAPCRSVTVASRAASSLLRHGGCKLAELVALIKAYGC